jgi:hypothetical protein
MVLLGGLALASAVACSSSDPASSGSDSGTGGADVGDASTDVDRPEERADAGSGATFTDLYRDFFGPTGQASCAGDGLCHGSPEKAGAKGSSGFVCGIEKTACWTSMTTGASALVTSADATNPSTSTLVLTLRHRRPDGAVIGNMPKRPLYVFSVASMQRITAWIAAGARND